MKDVDYGAEIRAHRAGNDTLKIRDVKGGRLVHTEAVAKTANKKPTSVRNSSHSKQVVKPRNKRESLTREINPFAISSSAAGAQKNKIRVNQQH